MFKKKQAKTRKYDGNINDLFANPAEAGVEELVVEDGGDDIQLGDGHNEFFNNQETVDDILSLDEDETHLSKKELKKMMKEEKLALKKEKKQKKKNGKHEVVEALHEVDTLQMDEDVHEGPERDIAVDLLNRDAASEFDDELAGSEFDYDEWDVDDIEEYVNEVIGLLGFVKADMGKYNLGRGEFDLGYYITRNKNSLYLHVPFSIKTRPYKIRTVTEQVMTSDSFKDVLINLDSDMLYGVTAYRQKLNTNDIVSEYSAKLHKSLHSYEEASIKKLSSFYEERRKSFAQNMEDVEEVVYTVTLSKKIDLSIEELNSDSVFVAETREFVRQAVAVMGAHKNSLISDFYTMTKSEILSFLVYTLTQERANFTDKGRDINMTQVGKWAEYTDANIFINEAMNSLRNSIRVQDIELVNNELTRGEAQAIISMRENDKILLDILTDALNARVEYTDANGNKQYVNKNAVNNMN